MYGLNVIFPDGPWVLQVRDENTARDTMDAALVWEKQGGSFFFFF